MKKHVHVIAAVIKNEQGEIFCAKRSSNMTLPNYWEFPGGKIELGESKVEALIREIKEELQCIIEVDEQIEDTFYEYDTFTINLYTYWAKILNGQPTLSEHATFKWLPYDELQKLDWAPADIPTVRKVVQQCMKEFTNN